MRCGPQLRTDAGRQYRSKQVLYLLRAFCEVHKINDSFRTNAYTIVDLPLRRAHGLRGGGPHSPLHLQALLPEASDKSICAYPSTILSPPTFSCPHPQAPGDENSACHPHSKPNLRTSLRDARGLLKPGQQSVPPRSGQVGAREIAADGLLRQSLWRQRAQRDRLPATDTDDLQCLTETDSCSKDRDQLAQTADKQRCPLRRKMKRAATGNMDF